MRKVPNVSVEQHCRNLLSIALRDNLVLEPEGLYVNDNPQSRTAADMAGMAEYLSALLAQRDE